MSTDMVVKELREIKRLLARIAAVLAPVPEQADKPKSASSTTSVTRNAVTHGITESGDDADVPEQLAPWQKEAKRWQERPHPVGKRRTDRQPVEGRGR